MCLLYYYTKKIEISVWLGIYIKFDGTFYEKFLPKQKPPNHKTSTTEPHHRHLGRLPLPVSTRKTSKASKTANARRQRAHLDIFPSENSKKSKSPRATRMPTRSDPLRKVSAVCKWCAFAPPPQCAPSPRRPEGRHSPAGGRGERANSDGDGEVKNNQRPTPAAPDTTSDVHWRRNCLVLVLAGWGWFRCGASGGAGGLTFVRFLGSAARARIFGF